MRLLRRFPIMVFSLVLLGIVGYCTALKSVELMLVAGALAALSWYVTEGPRGRTLPKWVSNVLVVAATLNVVVGFTQSAGTLNVIGQFCVWLTLIKLYERRTARDHGHLMALSLLLMLIGCLKSTELLFGVVLLAYAVLGLYVLLLYQLYAARESVSAARRASSPRTPAPAPMLRPTVGRHTALQFQSLAAGVGVCGMLLSAALFVIFPRDVGREMFGGPTSSARQTGYADEIDLNSGTRITDSRRPVFEMRLVDQAGHPVRAGGPLLLRGAVLDNYMNGRWTASRVPRERLETETGRRTNLGSVSRRPAGAVTQHFRFHLGTTTVFSLYVPTALEADGHHRFAYDPTTQTLRTTPDAELLRSCTMVSQPTPSDELVAAVSGGARAEPVQIGYSRDASDRGVRRIRTLAESLLEEAGLWPAAEEASARRRWGLQAAETLAEYLRSERFQYALDISDVVRGEEDPVAHFLFESRRGHCEYFASALAVMCHSVGIDARVVTGYAATAYDEAEDVYVVLACHAHAWVEVRSGAYRFTAVDPTPPRVLEPRWADRPTLAQRVNWFYERLEGGWRRRIIDFDSRSQAGLVAALDAGWSQRAGALVDDVQDWMQRVNRAFSFGPVGYLWLGLVGFAGVLAVLAVGKIVRRVRSLQRALHVRRLRDAESRRLILQLGFYLDMLAVLRRSGSGKPAWQTPLAHAGKLGLLRPRAGELMRRLTRLYYEARYGGRRLSGPEMDEARRLVRDLATVLEVRP